MERLKEALHIALSNLSSNVIRSVLSILGVVIGIASVIIILSIGAGAKKQILQQISSMGVNVYYLSSRYDETTQRIGSFELQDMERLEQLPFVLTAFPQLNLYKTLRSRTVESRGMVSGVTASYMTAQNLQLIKGRNFSPIEMENRTPVCLISDTAEETLFPGAEATDQSVFIEGIPWQIIGVYTKFTAKGQKNKDYSGEIEVVASLPALIRRSQDLSIQSVEVHVHSDAGNHAGEEILQTIERDDPNRKGLFMVRDQKDFYQRTLEVQRVLSLIGIMVAGISLIVGGIGMMNVMLTSVAERTREIGLRRAVGARKKDILFQFLVESCVLSGAGGTLGLVMGAAVARALPVLFKDFFHVAPRIQPTFLLIAVGTGVVLGITFGFYPAVKASKLSPAEALRSE